jgi:hypothetical protein
LLKGKYTLPDWVSQAGTGGKKKTDPLSGEDRFAQTARLMAPPNDPALAAPP